MTFKLAAFSESAYVFLIPNVAAIEQIYAEDWLMCQILGI